MAHHEGGPTWPEPTFSAAGVRQARLVAMLLALQVAAASLMPVLGSAGEAPPLYEWVSPYVDARARVSASFEYSPHLLCAQAKVHGPMTKYPPERPEHHLSDEHFQIHRSHTVPIRQTDVWYVSHKHRFIYVRGHKAGSTSITRLFQRMFCNQKNVDKCDQNVLARLTGSEVQQIPESTYMDYFVFSFVRNPLTRLASGYLHFAVRLQNWEDTHRDKGRPGECAAVPFSLFARDTFKFVRWCRKQECWPGKITWKDSFSAYTEDGLDMHFNDQSHNSFRPDGRAVVDFIGRVESFDEDWDALLAMLSARNKHEYSAPSKGHHTNYGVADPPPGSRKKQFVNTCEADIYEGLYDEQTARDIAIQYAPDFLSFGFAMNPAELSAPEGGAAQ